MATKQRARRTADGSGTHPQASGILTARIRENEAQRRYDRRATYTSSAFTLITLVVTAMTGLSLFQDAQIDQRQISAENEARLWDARFDQYTAACRDVDRPAEVRKAYCDDASLAFDVARGYSKLAERLDGINFTKRSSIGLLVMAGAFLSCGLYLWLRSASLKLHEAQSQRLVHEEALIDKDRRHRLLSRHIAGRCGS